MASAKEEAPGQQKKEGDNGTVTTGTESGKEKTIMTDEAKSPGEAAATAEAASRTAQAASQTAQTAAQAAQSAVQTGAGQTDVAAGYRSSGAETIADIGQSEAYLADMKNIVAEEFHHAMSLRDFQHRRARNAEDFDQTMRRASETLVTNLVTIVNNANNMATGELSRTVRHSDLAIDRQWNIDEVAAAIAKNPVFQDALAAAMAAAVAAAMSQQKAA